MDIFAWAKLPSKNVIEACLKYVEAKKLKRIYLRNKFINDRMLTYKKRPTWYRKIGIYYTREEAEAIYGKEGPYYGGTHCYWDHRETGYNDIIQLHDLALVSDFVYVSNDIFHKIEPFYREEMIEK